MNPLTWLFLAFLAAFVAVQLWLLQRHLAHVRRHRHRVPAPFDARITLDEHRKAADYTAAKVRLARWDIVAEALVVLAWTLGGGLALVDALWRELVAGEVLRGVGVLATVVVVGMIIDLPFSAYRTFVIEERFGFNRTTPRLFAADQAKHLLVLLALGVPLALALVATVTHAGTWWWLYAWLLWLGFSLLMVWAYPTLIAPLFNRFEPLDNADLRARVERLLERNGLATDGVFVMDGSRRSGHGNAYFTGFGRQKRIVFFDTLLQSLADDEVEAVLAHEVGHYKRRHIVKRLAAFGASSLAGLALLGWLMHQGWFYAGLGVPEPSGYMALALFMLVAPVFLFFLTPLGAWLSRRHEYEADDFAARESDPEVLVQALVKLYQENASTLTPDPLYSAFHDSHPPAPLRVAHLQAARG
jgi:STE24 endopeptidase